MKKYYMMVIALGITLGVIATNYGPRLAEKQNENSKKVLEMYSSLTGQNEEDFVSDYDPEENAPDLEGEFEYYQEQTPQEDQESVSAPEVTDTTYLMVNDDVYHILKEAKLNFLHLYANGSIPTQMKNRGITLSQENYDYIDSNMHSAYTCICNYVDAYEKNQIGVCCDMIGHLQENYIMGMSRNYLYDTLVRPKLSAEYQADMVAGYERNDGDGNICLVDGHKICVIGDNSLDPEKIVCLDETIDLDDYSAVCKRMEWFADLPNLIFSQYHMIENTGPYTGIGYIWNETSVENRMDQEWTTLKDEGSTVYGFNPRDTKITWDEEKDSYVYEDQDGYIYGPLPADDNARVFYMNNVYDALISREGDVYALDWQIQDVVADQGGYQFTY